MYNWSTNTKQFKKTSPGYARWHLEQLINYGLAGEKISTRELRKYWNKIEIHDPARRRLLKLLLQ